MSDYGGGYTVAAPTYGGGGGYSYTVNPGYATVPNGPSATTGFLNHDPYATYGTATAYMYTAPTSGPVPVNSVPTLYHSGSFMSSFASFTAGSGGVGGTPMPSGGGSGGSSGGSSSGGSSGGGSSSSGNGSDGSNTGSQMARLSSVLVALAMFGSLMLLV